MTEGVWSRAVSHPLITERTLAVLIRDRDTRPVPLEERQNVALDPLQIVVDRIPEIVAHHALWSVDRRVVGVLGHPIPQRVELHQKRITIPEKAACSGGARFPNSSPQPVVTEGDLGQGANAVSRTDAIEPSQSAPEQRVSPQNDRRVGSAHRALQNEISRHVVVHAVLLPAAQPVPNVKPSRRRYGILPVADAVVGVTDPAEQSRGVEVGGALIPTKVVIAP